YVSGDANANNLLDVGETWLYTSTGARYVSTGQLVPAYTVKTGQYLGTASLSAVVPGMSLTAASSDRASHWGQSNGEGLAPAFWQANASSSSAVAWPRTVDRTGTLIYAPGQLLTSVFTVPSSYNLGSTTLLQALGLTDKTGGKALVKAA